MVDSTRAPSPGRRLAALAPRHVSPHFFARAVDSPREMEQLAVEPGSAAGVHVDAGAQAQAQDLRGRLVAELRDGLLDQAASMPLRNYAALARVISLCRDHQASARSIALEAGRDETFAALLLRIANSAYSAAVVPIGTLTHAVARLGLDFVHGLAVATIGVPGLDVAHRARGELAAPRLFQICMPC